MALRPAIEMDRGGSKAIAEYRQLSGQNQVKKYLEYVIYVKKTIVRQVLKGLRLPDS